MDLLIYIFKNIFIFDNKQLYLFLANNYYLVNYFIFILLAFIFSFPIFKKIDESFKSNKIYLFIN